MKFIYHVPDYEHSGDLEWAKKEIQIICSEVTNLKGFEERDYEAEHEYEDEYGECDEYIYQGYVEFDAPKSYKEKLEDFGCYER